MSHQHGHEHENEHESTLRVPVYTQRPDTWSRAVGKILPFIRCTYECHHEFSDAGNGYCARGFLGENFLHAAEHREREIHDYWKSILESKPLITDREFEGQWSGRGARSQSDRKRGLEKDAGNKFRILDLPCEIFMHIFEYAAGTYELKADILRLCHLGYPNNTTHLILYHPRTWASMPAFQVCRAFRCLAIDYYGIPQQDSLPFSPRLDTLVISGEELDSLGRDKSQHGFGYGPYLQLQNFSDRDHWLLHDGVYSFNGQVTDVKPWSRVVKMSDDLLRRPKRITVNSDGGTPYTKNWRQIWSFVGSSFVNTESVRFKLCRLDTCSIEPRWQWGLVDGEQDEEGEEGGDDEDGEEEEEEDEEDEEDEEEYFKAHDIWMFWGFGKALMKSPPRQFFPKLETLEMARVAECCTRWWNTPEYQRWIRLLGLQLMVQLPA